MCWATGRRAWSALDCRYKWRIDGFAVALAFSLPGSDQCVRAAGELADLISGRPPAAPADPFEGPFGGTPSFEALLRGGS